MNKLLSAIILLSLIGCTNQINSSEKCDIYTSQAGQIFELCHESGTYTWCERSGHFKDITDSVEHWPITRHYVLDDKDTIFVEYPSIVDKQYDYIYVSTDNIAWITYKESK